MKIKAIKIDVTKQDVYAVDIDNDLQGLYSAIGCSCLYRIVLDERNDLWIDDEGLLKNPQPAKFLITGFAQPLAGNGLICGYNDEGETISMTLTADQVRPLITFLGDVPTPIVPPILISF